MTAVRRGAIEIAPVGRGGLIVLLEYALEHHDTLRARGIPGMIAMVMVMFVGMVVIVIVAMVVAIVMAVKSAHIVTPLRVRVK